MEQVRLEKFDLLFETGDKSELWLENTQDHLLGTFHWNMQIQTNALRPWL